MDVNQIIQGDALEMLSRLPDASIQCCVTSPPYFGLRDYGVERQIGLEETPEAYVSKLVEVFKEVRRVLRHDGTLWLNLGDSYASQAGQQVEQTKTGRYGAQSGAWNGNNRKPPNGFKPKDLIGIPWMVAFALRTDGWYLRSDIIWSKPNCMPESVEDRPTKSHEYIFLFAKSERYYYDADAIREPHTDIVSVLRHKDTGRGNQAYALASGLNHYPQRNSNSGLGGHELGRNKRSVWTIPTTPYSEAHFATFPPKLIESCILAGTSPRACEHCGSPWQRITETERIQTRPGTNSKYGDLSTDIRSTGSGNVKFGLAKRILPVTSTTGWQPTCTCTNEGTGKCIVLDPFMGAGTTALVAIQHGRNYLGIELNPSYVQLAEKRIATVQQNLWSTSGSEAMAVS